MELTIADINRIAYISGVASTNRTLEALGKLNPMISQTEVIEVYGRAKYNHSLKYVKWIKKGNAKSSPVECKRSEFDLYLIKFDEELKPIKK